MKIEPTSPGLCVQLLQVHDAADSSKTVLDITVVHYDNLAPKEPMRRTLQPVTARLYSSEVSSTVRDAVDALLSALLLDAKVSKELSR